MESLGRPAALLEKGAAGADLIVNDELDRPEPQADVTAVSSDTPPAGNTARQLDQLGVLEAPYMDLVSSALASVNQRAAAHNSHRVCGNAVVQGAASDMDQRFELTPEAMQTAPSVVAGSAAQEGEDDDDAADWVEEMQESDDGSEVAQNVVCEACASGIDEDQLLICDGCDHARHTYCARPMLGAVPVGDWHCEVCSLQAQVKKLIGDHVGASAPVREELARVSHGVRELWQFKVPLSHTSCQLLLHLREFVEALDRGKLRPLMEQWIDFHRQQAATERKRQHEEHRHQRESQREFRRSQREFRRSQREVAAILETVLRKVERASQSAVKEQARVAKERALVQVREERHAARREREGTRIRADVQRCLDRLLTKVRLVRSKMTGSPRH